jgi:nitroimidazol reductase NimA-like FMN-containing flavoprotein (pyridoxamine 5'-phosphate oxidase superfamily)
MGLAPAQACYMDHICILFGASVPFIFREEGDHYVIIGEAYVHGFMYGRAIEMIEQGELEAKEIHIL